MAFVRGLSRAASAAALVLVSTVCQAGAVNYRLTLTVDGFGWNPSTLFAPPDLPADADCQTTYDAAVLLHPTIPSYSWGCRQIGEAFTGTLQVSDLVDTLADGAQWILLKSFHLEIGQVVYDVGPAPGSGASSISAAWPPGSACAALSGKPYPAPIPPDHVALPAIISGGDLTGLCAQAHYPMDAPNLVFSGEDGRFGGLDAYRWTIFGTYSIERIPEPGTIALAGLALACLAGGRRRRVAGGERQARGASRRLASRRGLPGGDLPARAVPRRQP